MRRFPLLALLAALLILPGTVCAFNWADTAAKVEKSLVRLTYVSMKFDSEIHKPYRAINTCTGFSVNERNSYFVTAHHCLNYGTAVGLTIDGLEGRLLFSKSDLDLAVVTADLHKPALKASRKKLRKGDQVAALGYGYGMSEALFHTGFVAHTNLDPGELFSYPGPRLVLDSPFIGGMSGGPIFSTDEGVVGIIQQSDGLSGSGVDITTVLNVTGFYWQ